MAELVLVLCARSWKVSQVSPGYSERSAQGRVCSSKSSASLCQLQPWSENVKSTMQLNFTAHLTSYGGRWA